MTFDKETIPGGLGGRRQPDGETQAQLVCFEGSAQSLDLDAAESSIGRQSDNDLVLPSDRVSRHHVRIIRVGRDHYVEDLGSVNGTLLNGRRLRPNQREVLRHKDVVQVCEYRMLFLDFSGFAQKLGLATIRLDSEAVRKEASQILKDFLGDAGRG